MSTYLLINILSIVVPLVASFHPKLKFHLYWKHVAYAIGITMIPFVLWDVYFTHQGYWGFNTYHLLGLYLFQLPLEEWMFFICIPYSCMFTHVTLEKLYPDVRVGVKTMNYITGVLLLVFATTLTLNIERAYTLWDMTFSFIL